MHPDLERALQQFTDVEKQFEQLITANADRINKRPTTGGWSIAECVDHVNTVIHALVPRMREAINKAKADGKHATSAPLKSGFVGKYMTRSMEPAWKKKMKTMKIYEPTSNLDAAVLIQQYREAHNTFRQVIREADEINISKVKMTSPAMRLVKMNLGDWFYFSAAHERRHLWQAEQVANSFK